MARNEINEKLRWLTLQKQQYMDLIEANEKEIKSLKSKNFTLQNRLDKSKKETKKLKKQIGKQSTELEKYRAQ